MRPIHWILLLIPTLFTLGLYYFGPEHPYPHVWDQVPLFYGLFGFVGCIAIIFFAKAVGKAVLLKPEDYYDRDT